MAGGAASVVGLSQCELARHLLGSMAFLAGHLFTLPVNEPARILIQPMMTNATAFTGQCIRMDIMGKNHRRSSELAKNIRVGQIVAIFLGHRIVPADCNNQTNSQDQPEQ